MKKLLYLLLTLILALCFIPVFGCDDGKKFTITLDADGGSVSPATIRFNTGDVLENIPVPTKDGYVFSHWFIEESHYVLTEGEKINLRCDATARAVYQGANEYTINYVLDGGSLITEFPQKYSPSDENDTAIPNPERTGYMFLGWSGYGEGLKEDVVISKHTGRNIVLTAHWEEKVYTVKVRLIAFYVGNNDKICKWGYTMNGSGEISEKTVKYGQYLDILGNNVVPNNDYGMADDFRFICWFVNDGSIVKGDTDGGRLMQYANSHKVDASTPFIKNTVGKNNYVEICIYAVNTFTGNL